MTHIAKNFFFVGGEVTLAHRKIDSYIINVNYVEGRHSIKDNRIIVHILRTLQGYTRYKKMDWKIAI